MPSCGPWEPPGPSCLAGGSLPAGLLALGGSWGPWGRGGGARGVGRCAGAVETALTYAEAGRPGSAPGASPAETQAQRTCRNRRPGRVRPELGLRGP